MNRSPTTRGDTSFTKWTPEKCEQLAQLWAGGFSGSEIGAVMGCSRMAVIGKAHRMNLPKRRQGFNDDAMKRRYGATKPRKKPVRPPRSNLVGRTSQRDFKHTPTVKVARPAQHATDAALVADWLAQHGGPRKFERGDSSHPDAIQFYLRDRGYTLAQRYHGGVILKGDRGRPRRMSIKQLIAFVDDLREAEGLERIAA